MSTRSKVIQVRSTAWSSRPTGYEWHRAQATRRCECGTCRRASVSTRSKVIQVSSVVFSPDGSRVASGSSDQTVRVWDVANSTEIFNYDAGRYGHQINFSEDSSHVLVDGSLLSLPPQTLLSTTTARTPGPSPNLRLAIKDHWVTSSSQRIVWLPPEYRPGRWASLSDMMVICSGIGRVTFIHCVGTPSSS